MKAPKILCGIAALAFSLTASQAVETDPVGFVSVTVPANSDAVLAIPMNRASEFKGVISSIAGSVITVTGSPGWTINQFSPGTTANKTYALQIASGANEGMIGKVTANTANSVTVQLEPGDTLAGVVAGATGDQVDIMPFWTPSTLFTAAPPTGSELIGFVNAGVGINLGASEVYQHTGSNVWEDGVNGGSGSHIPLNFGASYILRNAGASPATLSFVGSVPMSAHRIRIATLAGNTEQDVSFGYMSPVPEALSTIGNPSIPVVNQTPNALGFPLQAGDTIIGFDNSEVGINKGAAEVYLWTGTAFEDQVNGGNVTHTTTLKPGFGYIFRKAATANPTSAVWTHVQSYLQ